MREHRVRGPSITYSDHSPAATLSQHVVNYWTMDVSPEPRDVVHFVPPDGCTHVAFNGALRVLIGPHVRPLNPPITPGARWFGVRFQPGAARLFLRSSRLPRLRNQVVRSEGLAGEPWVMELGDLLARTSPGSAQRAAANTFLGQMLPSVGEVSHVVRATVERLVESRGRMRVTELARWAGVSDRHLRRAFTAAVDLSPKESASAWRLRLCALRILEPAPQWAALAADAGFADQAHLTREFRRWVGLTPQALARQTAAIEHGELRWGATPIP